MIIKRSNDTKEFKRQLEAMPITEDNEELTEQDLKDIEDARKEESDGNPFDVLAEHALYQYEQGNCVEIREFARKNKIKVSK